MRGRSGSVTGLRAAAVGSPRALGARRSAHAPLEAASPPRNRPRPRWKAGWAPPCSRGTSTRTARCRSTTSCACEESSGEGNTNVLDGCTQRTCSAAQRYTAQRQDHASAGTSAPSPPANRGSCLHTIKQSKSVLAVADSRVLATIVVACSQRMRARTGRLRISGAVPYMPPGAAPSGSPSPSSAGSDSGNCEMFLCEQQASGQ